MSTKSTGYSFNIFFQDVKIPDYGLSRLSLGLYTHDLMLGPPDGRSNTSAAAELRWELIKERFYEKKKENTLSTKKK